MSENVRASLLMVLSMAGFAVEDMLIKQLSVTIPVGQMLVMLGIGGAVFFATLSLALGKSLWSGQLTSGPMMLRSAAEMFSTMAGVTALTLIPLSLASSILQAAPILVTLGAALFLGEKVGVRRWSAICVGLFGVLLILRPGTDGFNPAVWLAVAAVVALAARDLATRVVPASLSTLQLTFWAWALSIPAGLILFTILGRPAVWPDRSGWMMLAATQVLGITFYYTLTMALRIGEASVVVPFRYTRLVFALALGVFVLGETIDGLMVAGLVLVTGSGLYSLLREARHKRQAGVKLASATVTSP